MEETKGFVSAKDALAALEQYQGCFFPHCAAVKIVNQLVQTDVAPVVRGHWTERHLNCVDKVMSFCSECLTFHNYQTNYCPNCGAKMEEKVEHADA